jgi:hypothetical protein
MGHALGENRNGLIVAITVTEANGTAERTAALAMLDGVKATPAVQPKTLGADKGFDSGEFFQELESRGIEPHVPLVKEPCDPETVAHGQRKAGVEARHRMKARQSSDGFRLSQKCRKKIEEVFGWLKEIAGLGRSRVVGRLYCAPRTGRKKWLGEWGSIDQQHPWKTEDGPPAPSFGFPSWG